MYNKLLSLIIQGEKHIEDYFKLKEDTNYWIITLLEKDITIYNSREIADQMLASIEKGNSKHLIIDTAYVTYMDSSFIGKLIFINKKLSVNDKKIFITSANADLMKIVHLAKLDRVFEICDDVESAIFLAEGGTN